MSSPDFNVIKGALRQLTAADSELKDIIDSAVTDKNAVEAALSACADSSRSRVLESIDVSELNRDKLGIRVGALRNAGFTNVRQINETSAGKLMSIEGIGEDTAYKIKAIARRISEEVKTSTFVRMLPESRTEETDALVKAIYVLRESREIRKQAKTLYDCYHDEFIAAASSVRPATGRLLWMFASSAKKAAAEAAAARLLEIPGQHLKEEAAVLSEQKELLGFVPVEHCWKDFERNSAAYYASLESFQSDVIRAAGLLNGLPEQLAKEVEKVPLDLTGLKCTLRSYQTFGVQYVLNQGAVLLGDEMGLGKTVQAIAAMVALRNSGETHFMVVCPASVLVNWCREIVQHSDLEPLKIHGSDRSILEKWIYKGGVAVTTYETISRFTLPEDFTFGMLVADEAHYVKNPQAIRTRALLRLRRMTSRVMYMTGTPLENNVDEMCFLIDCLNPEVSKVIDNVRYLSAAPQFREAVSSVYFRRSREDVLKELPDLIESMEWLDMNREEAESYALDVASGNFMAMRRVSWDVDDITKSSKAQRLLEICDMAKEEGRKVIVFSYFIDTIKKVVELLGDDRCVQPINGSGSPVRRQEILDEFNEAPAGFVLPAQIQAGGTGLNIQAASVVVICEPQIKPSIETQAISRAYRMGQARSVLVYKLLCEDTVDERIVELLETKQEIFDNFAEDSVSGLESLKLSESSAAALIKSEQARLAAKDQTE